MVKQSSETLVEMINTIQVKPFSIGKNNSRSIFEKRTQWSQNQNNYFFQLMKIYGADYSILSVHFPHKSYQQIRKKFISLQKAKNIEMQRCLKRTAYIKKKNFFDDVILENTMITYCNKPNCSEN